MRIDPVKTSLFETKVKNASDSFATIPGSPERLTNPVTQLSFRVVSCDSQRDRANKLMALFELQSKNSRLSRCKCRFVPRNPAFRHAIEVRMRDVEGGGGNLPITSQVLDGWGVGRTKRAYQQPSGSQRWLIHV
jgi:hypothetical protein